MLVIFRDAMTLFESTLLLLTAFIIADMWMRERGGIPILMYHSISDSAAWLPWSKSNTVSLRVFERHLQTIQKMGLDVMLTSDFVRARKEGLAVSENVLLIHLDDGYLDNWVAAVPLLQKYGLAATIFVSLDFIDPSEEPRPKIFESTSLPLEWKGYMNLTELKALEETPGIEIEPHGLDHGRVETGERVVDTVTIHNWRNLAWVQWAATPGNKSNWFRAQLPEAVPLGHPIREHQGAFVGRAWLAGVREQPAEYESRIRHHLHEAKIRLETLLNKKCYTFCWPENLCNELARRIAAEEGYLATTAGAGENRASEPPHILSRIHVPGCAAGIGWLPLEALYLRASIRLFQGNYYWYPIVLMMNASKRLLEKLGVDA